MKDPRAKIGLTEYLENLEGVGEVLDSVRTLLTEEQAQEIAALLQIGEARPALESLADFITLNNAPLSRELAQSIGFYLKRLNSERSDLTNLARPRSNFP